MLTDAQRYYILNKGSSYPSVPTRKQVLSVHMHFRGGLLVPSQQYGLMPWWPTALSWLDNYNDRQQVYRVSKMDTHQIVHIPNGPPLYNEPPPNFYNGGTFGPRDWTNGMTKLDSRFSDLIDEVIEAGFRYIITMDESWPNSYYIMQMAMSALSERQIQYGFVMPGYDGVFYGWPPEIIAQWMNRARAMRSNVYTGIEHQPGRIPTGDGEEDWRSSGTMANCDILLGEHTQPHSDSTWQVLGRTIRPFFRPPDMPSWDDPNPPFYLIDSIRGPREYCVFETMDPYYWVRVNPNDANAVNAAIARIESEDSYFRLMGVQYLG
jgi:hypothetical protein